MRVENDNGDFAIAQHAQLVGLLHQAELPFGKGYLAIPLVRNLGDLDLFPSHFDF